MNFLKDFLGRLRHPWIYVALGINFVLAWPIASSAIFIMENLAGKQPWPKRLESFWSFFQAGYSSNLYLLLAASGGTMFLFTFFYAWLRYKNDSILERHYLRAILGGSILGIINLFPAFYIYQTVLRSTAPKSMIVSLLGPLLAIGFIGPTVLVAGLLQGLVNGILAHIVRRITLKKLITKPLKQD